jgi:hypothetical protein
MSDGMAFLTGAAFAGVAVLFLMRGGPNLGVTTPPVAQLPPVSPTTATTPFGNGTIPQVQPSISPGSALYNPNDQQQLVQLLEQQRTEMEQLRQQLQSQQSLIQKLTTETDANANSLFAQAQPAAGVNSFQQQQDNPALSGLIWALGGMAVTISGGVVVVGALSVLSRQQRSPRTTYVVQHPYAALPPTVARRREYMPPPVMERQVDPLDYD